MGTGTIDTHSPARFGSDGAHGHLRLQGKQHRTVLTKGSGNGQLHRPLGIATARAGLIYVDDYGNSRISVFTPAP